MLVWTGCATSSNKAAAPDQGSYSDGSNDRHSVNRVSNNLSKLGR